MQGKSSRRAAWLAALVVLLLVVAGSVAFLTLGGEDEAQAQTIRFQDPTESGPDPFTEPAERKGPKLVKVGSGPFGGTGSDLVCDRELLIRSLIARPDRLREWARVLGVAPTERAVTSYIRHLRPVTLTRDTQVTNHSFVNGRAVAFQSILQAGTSVLVDKDGVPVARCRCGNPLLQPIFVAEAKCFGCPQDYIPPPRCEYYDYDDRDYDRYGDAYWKRVYVLRDFVDVCYLPYPDPPSVRGRRHHTPRAKPAKPKEEVRHPAAAFSPPSGTAADSYTLYASGFRPNVTLTVRLVRPDGVGESYSITTGGSGSGSYTFPPVANPVLGTYTATITDPGTGDSASASTTVNAAPTAPEPEPTDELQCDPPRSQLEAEQCAELQGVAPENTPVPEEQQLPVCDPVAPVEPCRDG